MRKRKNLIGQRVGRLVVIGPTDQYSGASLIWRCLCDCGTEVTVNAGDLMRKRKPIRSCGCSRTKDLTGQRFGRLVAIRPTALRNKAGGVKWECLCDCGKTAIAESGNLHSGGMTSCGCQRSGKLHPRWNDDLTDEERCINRAYPSYNEWRKAVYEQDGYACKRCGDKSGNNLNAHHIESYTANRELRTTVRNGVTLCEDCHADFHHVYGRGNNTREQLEEWFNKSKVWAMPVSSLPAPPVPPPDPDGLRYLFKCNKRLI